MNAPSIHRPKRGIGAGLGLIIGMVLPTGGAVALPFLEPDLVWTAPASPVAGSPTQVLFEFFGTDGYRAVLRQVSLEGSRVVVEYDLTGEITGTDVVLYQTVYAATLPPLETGTYTLVWRGHGADGSSHDEEIATIGVSAGTPTIARPAQGYWAAPDEPGSGLFLEQKGDVLAVALYSFSGRAASPSQWWLGAAPVLASDVLLALHTFTDGTCLGCPGTGPQQRDNPAALRMRFESARRAWVDINGSATVPMTSLPYGAAYVPVALADPLDAEFGPLPLPDLLGEWVFAIEDDFFAFPIRLDFNELALGEDSAEFRQGEDARIQCVGADGTRGAGCEYQWTGLIFTSPPPGTFPYTAWFDLGDIEEDRMQGIATWQGRQLRVRAFRIDERETVTPAPPGS